MTAANPATGRWAAVSAEARTTDAAGALRDLDPTAAHQALSVWLLARTELAEQQLDTIARLRAQLRLPTARHLLGGAYDQLVSVRQALTVGATGRAAWLLVAVEHTFTHQLAELAEHS